MIIDPRRVHSHGSVESLADLGSLLADLVAQISVSHEGLRIGLVAGILHLLAPVELALGAVVLASLFFFTEFVGEHQRVVIFRNFVLSLRNNFRILQNRPRKGN